MEESDQAVASMIRPWYASLRDSGSLGALDDSGTAWINVGPNHGRPPPVTPQFLEGMVLLTLLARHDQEIWRQVVTEIWPTEDAKLTDTSSQFMTMGLDWIIDDAPDLNNLSDFAASTEGFSADFPEAVAMLKHGGSTTAALEKACIPVIVDCDLHGSARDDLSRIIQAIHDLSMSLQLLIAPGGVKFHIDQIRRVMCGGPSLDLNNLELLARMMDQGIRVMTLPALHSSCAWYVSDANRLITALRTVMLPTTRGSCVENVRVTDDIPWCTLDAVLSAVQDNTSIRSLYLRLQDDTDYEREDSWPEQRDVWELIASRVFSRHTRHQLETLILGLEIGDQAIEGVRSALAQDAINYGRDKELRNCRLTASRFYLEHPVHESRGVRVFKRGHVYTSPCPVDVSVQDHLFLPDQSEWWACLLPGCGQAWVESCDVVSLATVDDQIHHSQTRSFTEIHVELTSDDSMQRLPTLLAMISHETKIMSVHQLYGFEPYDVWIGHVLAACPVLEELIFHNGLFLSLTAFVDCAAAGVSHLRCLSLVNVETLNYDDIDVFFRTLCNPRHALTTHLQELSIEIVVDHLDVVSMVSSLLEMLHENRVLRKVSLIFKLRGPFMQLEPMLEAVFVIPQLCKVAIATGPVDMRSKLAFLSALDVKHPTVVEDADISVLALIFQYAAPMVLRDLQVRIAVQDEDRP